MSANDTEEAKADRRRALEELRAAWAHKLQWAPNNEGAQYKQRIVQCPRCRGGMIECKECESTGTVTEDQAQAFYERQKL